MQIFILSASEINIISLNCHGFNAGTALYLQAIAHNADIILLQETWLCDATYLSLLTLFEILLFTTAQLWKTNFQLEYAQVDHLVVQLC